MYVNYLSGHCQFSIVGKDAKIIKPSIGLMKNNYKTSKDNEKGKFVKNNFIYSSNTNSHFLNVKDLKKFI